MKWIKASEPPPEKGFYKVRGLNNKGNFVEQTEDPIWFSGEFWVIREGCKVTEWLDESEIDSPPERERGWTITPPPPVQSDSHDGIYWYQPLFNLMSVEHGVTLLQNEMDEIINCVRGMLPVQSDSGVEEVLKAIHQNTQGPRYWPPIKLALDEYASLKTKELMEALEESNKENEILINGIEFFLNWLKEKRPSLGGLGAPIMLLQELLSKHK